MSTQVQIHAGRKYFMTSLRWITSGQSCDREGNKHHSVEAGSSSTNDDQGVEIFGCTINYHAIE